MSPGPRRCSSTTTQADHTAGRVWQEKCGIPRDAGWGTYTGRCIPTRGNRHIHQVLYPPWYRHIPQVLYPPWYRVHCSEGCTYPGTLLRGVHIPGYIPQGGGIPYIPQGGGIPYIPQGVVPWWTYTSGCGPLVHLYLRVCTTVGIPLVYNGGYPASVQWVSR